MLSLVLTTLLFMIAPLISGPAAYAAELPVPLSALYSQGQDAFIAQACAPESTLRNCKFEKQLQCQLALSTAYTSCYQEDLKKRSKTQVAPQEGAAIIAEVSACATRGVSFSPSEKACAENRSNALIQPRDTHADFLSKYKVADVTEPTPTPEPKQAFEQPLDSQFILRLNESTSMFIKLTNSIQSGDRAAVCPAYREQDWTGCVLESKQPIDSAFALDQALQLIILGAEKDKISFGNRVGVQLMVDRCVKLLEVVDLSRFFSRQLLTRTQNDRATAASFNAQENKYLQNIRTKFLPIMETGVSAVKALKPDTGRIAAPPSRVRSVAELEKQIRSLSEKKWKF